MFLSDFNDDRDVISTSGYDAMFLCRYHSGGKPDNQTLPEWFPKSEVFNPWFNSTVGYVRPVIR